jgi:hypothetical protein
LRAENEEHDKQDARTVLDSETVIAVDWAMKFNQLKYWEKQAEWYGKQGVNLAHKLCNLQN